VFQLRGIDDAEQQIVARTEEILGMGRRGRPRTANSQAKNDAAEHDWDVTNHRVNEKQASSVDDACNPTAGLYQPAASCFLP
jgi:hypothetical protein